MKIRDIYRGIPTFNPSTRRCSCGGQVKPAGSDPFDPAADRGECSRCGTVYIL